MIKDRIKDRIKNAIEILGLTKTGGESNFKKTLLKGPFLSKLGTFNLKQFQKWAPTQPIY